jgi:hypothetical protein
LVLLDNQIGYFLPIQFLGHAIEKPAIALNDPSSDALIHILSPYMKAPVTGRVCPTGTHRQHAVLCTNDLIKIAHLSSGRNAATTSTGAGETEMDTDSFLSC